ncbi:unnamed protein product, partial [Adineta ricciae]
PSAYQVRIAGCKGMLAIEPGSRFDQYFIKVRPSMEKFDSPDWNLEICEYSKPLPLKLNNQVIMLLSDLGNRYDKFESYQNQALTNSGQLNEHEELRKVRYSNTTDDLLKNNIPLPLNEARYMFGVVDETKTLKYGQVFIQYKDFDSSDESTYVVVTGDVLVAKMPCLYPGDFRRLTAVDLPELRKCIRDCIVFPQVGSRPHPSEMSGSDLDGDQYWVYWGKLFKIRNMDEPLSYEAATKAIVPNITRQIVVDHIVDSFGAASQGIICDVHLACADYHEKHTRSDDCKYLAELFARAVDAPKTGEQINLDRVYEIEAALPNEYPLFMKKFDKKVRPSDSTPNKLYERAKQHFFSRHRPSHAPRSSSTARRAPSKQQKTNTNSQDTEFEQWLTSQGIQAKSTVEKPCTTTELTSDSDTARDASRKPRITAKPSANSQSIEALPNLVGKLSRKSRPKNVPMDERRPSADSQTSAMSLDHEPSTKPKPEKRSGSKHRRPASRSASVDSRSKVTEEKNSNATAKEPNPQIKLINTAAPAATSLASSTMSSFSDNNANWNIIFNRMKTTAGRVKWNISSNGYFTVDLDGNSSSENNATDKLVSSLSEFGKKSSLPENAQLMLTISSGQLFLKPSPTMTDIKAKNIKELNQLIVDNHVEYVFEENDVKTITKEREPTKKSVAKYVLVCSCYDIAPNKTSLIFDDKKKLIKFMFVSTEWARVVRGGEERHDGLYKIYETEMEIDSKHELFPQYVNSIFKNSKETDLLSGTSPRLTIAMDLLRPSVQIILFKRMVRYEFGPLEQQKSSLFRFDTLSNVQSAFYQVTYIGTEKVNGKVPIRETIEFHATQFQITKKCEQDLKQLLTLPEEFFD